MSRETKNKCLFGAKHFLTISGDNRLRLWDIASNKELRCFVEKHHLSHSYTCFAWGQDESKKEGSGLGVCAVGTSDGQVIVWDLTRGVVARTVESAGGGASPAIADIQFSKDTQSIYVCSMDSSIFEYSVKTGETKQVLKGFKKGASCLAVHHKTVAAASGSVKLLGEGGKKLKLPASFPAGGVAVMSFSSCGKYLACAGAGSREFVLFGVDDWEEASEASAAALCVCAVSDVPQRLELAVVPCAGGKKGAVAVDVLCVLQQPEGGCVVRVDVSDGSTTMAPLGAGSADTSVLSGCFSSSAGSVTLATGKASSPRFVTLPYLDAASNSLVSTITLPTSGSAKANGISNESHEMDVEAAVSVLGPHESGGTKRPLVADGSAGPGDKRMKSGSSGGLDKLTVEERLNGAAAALLKMEALGAEAGSLSRENGTASSTATTDSLVTLVEQALQAGDDGLLEQCLDCSDADVVAETSKRLPTRLVVPLLRRLVAKFEKKPARGVLLTRWIHSLLRSHMSYLLSVPDLAQQLAALSQMLEQRLATYTRLSSLAGRLDLLLSQISSSAPSSRVEPDKGPAQTYYED